MKYLVMGHSGSGKSSLTKFISEIKHIPLLYLDCVHFISDWKARDDEEARKIVKDFMDKMEDKDIEICRNIAKTIFKNVETLLKGQIGNPKAGEFVKIGADGTPTSYIDIIAENEVIKILENAEFTSYLISEEIGELKLGYGKQVFFNIYLYFLIGILSFYFFSNRLPYKIRAV